jgi:hypothetical protein
MYEYNDEIEVIDYEKETELLFDVFKINKKMNIDFAKIMYFVNKFEKILNCENIFSEITNTKIDNYFCAKNNKMLVTSFIIMFLKIDDYNYDIKYINGAFISNYFIELGFFFNFMDYLDVENKFLNNLKTILTLYVLGLERSDIERDFHYNIEIIDLHFSNEIVPKVFLELNYNKIKEYKNHIETFANNYKKEYKEEITQTKLKLTPNEQEVTDNILLIIEKMQIYKIFNEQICFIKDKYDTYEELYEDCNENNEFEIFEYEIDFYTIFKCSEKYVREEREKYIKYTIINKYQKMIEKYENYLTNIRRLCANIKVNDYSEFKPNINSTIILLLIKTYIGIRPNIKAIETYFVKQKKEDIFNFLLYDFIFCACRLGYIDLFRECFDLYKKTITIDVVMYHMINRANSIIPYEFENYLKSIKFKRFIGETQTEINNYLFDNQLNW